jgi:hypothetical protein
MMVLAPSRRLRIHRNAAPERSVAPEDDARDAVEARLLASIATTRSQSVGLTQPQCAMNRVIATVPRFRETLHGIRRRRPECDENARNGPFVTALVSRGLRHE